MPKDTLETIMKRRSIRTYKPEPIPDEDLELILEAGRQSPSGGNRQPWHFVVVKDAELRKQVAAACNNQHWMADAAVILAAIGLPEKSPRWSVVDPTIAFQTMILAAHSLGYGTCWIGAYNDAKVRELLGIPPDVHLICLTPVGVPDAYPEARPRNPRSEVFSLNRYGKPYPD